MAVLAGLAATLHGAGGDDDLVIGAPIAGRTQPEIQDLLGFFANTLPIRVELAGRRTFRDLLAHARERALAAFAHDAVPFERVVRDLAPARRASHHPLFQVVLALQSPPAPLDAGGVRFAITEVDAGGAPFDLSFQVWEAGGALRGTLTYAVDLFDEATAARLSDALATLLAAVAADPDRALDAVDLPPIDRARSAACAACEDALRAAPDVADVAVRLRWTEALDPFLVAYVVPATADATLTLPAEATSLPLRPLLLSALPRDEDGRIDEAALRRLALVDADLARRCEDELRRAPGVLDAAVMRGLPDERAPAIHLAHVLP
jgi:non-ribosomal peptide synthetase component F